MIPVLLILALSGSVQAAGISVTATGPHIDFGAVTPGEGPAVITAAQTLTVIPQGPWRLTVTGGNGFNGASGRTVSGDRLSWAVHDPDVPPQWQPVPQGTDTVVAAGDGQGPLASVTIDYRFEPSWDDAPGGPYDFGVVYTVGAGIDMRASYASPNPFDPSRHLSMQVGFESSWPGSRSVHLKILDAQGQKVAKATTTVSGRGWQTVSWTGLDSGGVAAPDGPYRYRIEDALGGVIATGQFLIRRWTDGALVIVGHVLDSQASPLSGATVTLLSPFGRELGQTLSDGTGAFHFTNLRSGEYRLEVSRPGYVTYRSDILHLSAASSPLAVDVPLVHNHALFLELTPSTEEATVGTLVQVTTTVENVGTRRLTDLQVCLDLDGPLATAFGTEQSSTSQCPHAKRVKNLVPGEKAGVRWTVMVTPATTRLQSGTMRAWADGMAGTEAVRSPTQQVVVTVENGDFGNGTFVAGRVYLADSPPEVPMVPGHARVTVDAGRPVTVTPEGWYAAEVEPGWHRVQAWAKSGKSQLKVVYIPRGMFKFVDLPVLYDAVGAGRPEVEGALQFTLEQKDKSVTSRMVASAAYGKWEARLDTEGLCPSAVRSLTAPAVLDTDSGNPNDPCSSRSRVAALEYEDAGWDLLLGSLQGRRVLSPGAAALLDQDRETKASFHGIQARIHPQGKDGPQLRVFAAANDVIEVHERMAQGTGEGPYYTGLLPQGQIDAWRGPDGSGLQTGFEAIRAAGGGGRRRVDLAVPLTGVGDLFLRYAAPYPQTTWTYGAGMKLSDGDEASRNGGTVDFGIASLPELKLDYGAQSVLRRDVTWARWNRRRKDLHVTAGVSVDSHGQAAASAQAGLDVGDTITAGLSRSWRAKGAPEDPALVWADQKRGPVGTSVVDKLSLTWEPTRGNHIRVRSVVSAEVTSDGYRDVGMKSTLRYRLAGGPAMEVQMPAADGDGGRASVSWTAGRSARGSVQLAVDNGRRQWTVGFRRRETLGGDWALHWDWRASRAEGGTKEAAHIRQTLKGTLSGVSHDESRQWLATSLAVSGDGGGKVAGEWVRLAPGKTWTARTMALAAWGASPEQEVHVDVGGFEILGASVSVGGGARQIFSESGPVRTVQWHGGVSRPFYDTLAGFANVIWRRQDATVYRTTTLHTGVVWTPWKQGPGLVLGVSIDGEMPAFTFDVGWSLSGGVHQR